MTLARSQKVCSPAMIPETKVAAHRGPEALRRRRQGRAGEIVVLSVHAPGFSHGPASSDSGCANVTATARASPLRFTGGARDDAGMSPVSTTALALAALAALALLGPGCGERREEPVVVPADVHLAAGRPARPAAAAASPAETEAVDRLRAARTVALYCHLVDRGQYARAGELCVCRRLWSRRALGGVTRFHFRSARVYAAPDARTLVLKARVHVHAGRGRSLPGGLAVLFFTLGRAGSAVGGWLITAVSTRP